MAPECRAAPEVLEWLVSQTNYQFLSCETHSRAPFSRRPPGAKRRLAASAPAAWRRAIQNASRPRWLPPPRPPNRAASKTRSVACAARALVAKRTRRQRGSRLPPPAWRCKRLRNAPLLPSMPNSARSSRIIRVQKRLQRHGSQSSHRLIGRRIRIAVRTRLWLATGGYHSRQPNK